MIEPYGIAKEVKINRFGVFGYQSLHNSPDGSGKLF